MYLVLATAVLVICGADKLDRAYLPPASAKTAGGSNLQAPFRTFNQGLGGLPKGGHRNEFDGIVVDAAAPGTRASGSDGTGLGGPRIAYGSTHSKVGDAAFIADTAFPRISVHSGLNAPTTYTNVQGSVQERVQAPRDRASNILTYQSDVSQDGFNYVFETDNGITAREDAVEANGVNAQGGYSYTGDDGQVYSVTYTADERGYQPTGDHLPTPPPIPDEILKSLEQNAKDEAAGIVDDGSYDAQKYNTEEDYTKSGTANGNYKAQAYPIGSRPHSDTDASGSFNIQNNQEIARPGSIQFGSIPVRSSSTGANGFQLIDSSKNTPSQGNSFGGINGQNGQAIGFESGSNNKYLPPQNRRPAFSRPQNNIPSGFTQDTVSSSVNKLNAGINGQNSDAPVFVPLSQQKLQGDNSKSAQSNSPIFGKPTIIDSTLAIKDPFGSRPFRKPQVNAPVGGSFQVVSGNVYSSKNEYFPPRNQFNKPSQIKGTQGFQVTNSGSKSSQQLTDFKSPPNEYSLPSTTTFSPISRPTFGFQSSQKFSGQQVPQYTGNNSAGQLSQTTNNSPSIKHQSHSSSGFSNFNKGPDSQAQYRPSNFASQFPTLQPQTELTTPFETNFERNKFPDSFSANDALNSDTHGSSQNLQTFNSQLSNTSPGQLSSNTHNTHQVSETEASSSAFASVNSHVSTSAIQNVPDVGSFGNNFNSQFLNKSPADVQYASSTHRPSYSQNTQQQGADDSYFYNTPSQTFNTPTSRPQVSVFPSSLFDQFKVTQPSFGSKDQQSDYSHTSFGSQSKIPISTTGYTGSFSPETILPTVSSIQDENIGTSFQSQFNRVTQATATSFASPVPTPSVNFERNKLGQYSTSQSVQNNPQFSQESQSSSLFKQPGSVFAQASATVYGNDKLTGFANTDRIQGPSSQFQQTQQHNGEVYEYNKPLQSLPAPQKNPSKQFGQTSQFSTSLQTSQDSQLQNAESSQLSSQFGSKFTQQTGSSFGPTVQSSPINQGNQGSDINKPVQNQPQPESKPAQFGSFSSKPNQSFQITSESQAFNPNSQVQSQSDSDSRPGNFGFSSKPGQDSQLSQGNQAFSHTTPGQTRPQSDSRPHQLSSHTSRPSQNTQPIQGASKFPPVYDTEGPPCCKNVNIGSQSSQSNQQVAGSQFGDAAGADPGNGQNEQSSQGTKPEQSISTFPGVGEAFGGPRQPPSFDAEGYHY